MLLEELEHRVVNSLQIIASIIMLKARAVKSEETRRHLEDAHNRVISVATVGRTPAMVLPPTRLSKWDRILRRSARLWRNR